MQIDEMLYWDKEKEKSMENRGVQKLYTNLEYHRGKIIAIYCLLNNLRNEPFRDFICPLYSELKKSHHLVPPFKYTTHNAVFYCS